MEISRLASLPCMKQLSNYIAAMNTTPPMMPPDTSDPDRTLDYLELQIPSLSAAAVDVAFWQALGSGQAVLVSDDGGVYQTYPDGTRKLIKTTAQPLSMPVGTRVTIR
jgi:hypothetical protein